VNSQIHILFSISTTVCVRYYAFGGNIHFITFPKPTKMSDLFSFVAIENVTATVAARVVSGNAKDPQLHMENMGWSAASYTMLKEPNSAHLARGATYLLESLCTAVSKNVYTITASNKKPFVDGWSNLVRKAAHVRRDNDMVQSLIAKQGTTAAVKTSVPASKKMKALERLRMAKAASVLAASEAEAAANGVKLFLLMEGTEHGEESKVEQPHRSFVVKWAPRTSQRFDAGKAKLLLTDEQIDACTTSCVSEPVLTVSWGS
jgi:hypothetical protein